MQEQHTYDYAIVRVVPKVERGEFLNAGVILFCLVCDYLAARIELDEPRLLALSPDVDIESVRANLATVPLVCAGGEAAGPVGRLSQKERFHWLVAPRSTVVQTSPVHSGLTRNPDTLLEHLMNTMVRMPRG